MWQTPLSDFRIHLDLNELVLFYSKRRCIICIAHEKTCMLMAENILHHIFPDHLKETYFKDRRSL